MSSTERKTVQVHVGGRTVTVPPSRAIRTRLTRELGQDRASAWSPGPGSYGLRAAVDAYIDEVDEAEASGRLWRDEVRARPPAEQDRTALARLIEMDADPFEVELYERAAEPQVLSIDRAQRSRAGQYARHVRRLRERQQRRSS